MKRLSLFLAALLLGGIASGGADAQILRKVIGHVIVGKAARTLLGEGEAAENAAPAKDEDAADAPVPPASVPAAPSKSRSPKQP